MALWTPPEWRAADTYAAVFAGGRPALAWELLRRDPLYRAFVASADLDTDVESRWGLHFPG